MISATIIAAVISYYTSKKLNAKQNKASQDIEILKHQLERSREAETKSEQLQSIMKRYRDPLLRSAFELQSRFFNILKQNLLWVYLINGTTQERIYDSKHIICNSSIFWLDRNIAARYTIS